MVAFERIRSSYAEAIAFAISEMLPELEVRLCVLRDLERDLRSFDPHAVVCSRPRAAQSGARGAWIEIPTEDGLRDSERLAQICLDGDRWKSDGPPLAELVEVLDETQKRLREGNLRGSC